jgi:hypothetical protein
MPILLHDGQVNGVASGEAAVSEESLFGTFGNCPVKGEALHPQHSEGHQKQVECHDPD